MVGLPSGNSRMLEAGGTPHTWNELVAWKPDFPTMMHRWIQTMKRLVLASPVQDDDLIGQLITSFMTASAFDLNDLMTLTHVNSHSGAQNFLRSLFQRTVTLKYLVANPGEAQSFVGFNAIDWEQVLKG